MIIFRVTPPAVQAHVWTAARPVPPRKSFKYLKTLMNLDN